LKGESRSSAPAARHPGAAVVAKPSDGGYAACRAAGSAGHMANNQPDFFDTATPDIRSMFEGNARTFPLNLAAPALLRSPANSFARSRYPC
jgi:hypothetical protein